MRANVVSQASGLSIDAADKKGCTPLHLAGKAQSLGAINLLLDKSANPLAQDREQNTPIHLLVRALDIDAKAFQVLGVGRLVIRVVIACQS
jgi:ankyrin repeat protein